ncbi:hypothetical protein BDR06DRAFT_960789 [Suillus hirtellus]|nr:hypothetical protein BDR06DRAFT_960789 [Suillus hirtellus]
MVKLIQPSLSSALTFTSHGFLIQLCRSLSLFHLFSAFEALRILQKTNHIPFTPLSNLSFSLRAAVNKYHNELPHILLDGGGLGEAEESMMWYALGYEKVDGSAERNDHLTGEDNAMLEEKWRSGWLEHMEQREVQIQILLYFFKLSSWTMHPITACRSATHGQYFIYSPVKLSRLWKKKKEKPNLIIPSSIERLESFMDKLSMWQLAYLLHGTRTFESPTKSNIEHPAATP